MSHCVLCLWLVVGEISVLSLSLLIGRWGYLSALSLLANWSLGRSHCSLLANWSLGRSHCSLLADWSLGRSQCSLLADWLSRTADKLLFQCPGHLGVSDFKFYWCFEFNGKEKSVISTGQTDVQIDVRRRAVLRTDSLTTGPQTSGQVVRKARCIQQLWPSPLGGVCSPTMGSEVQAAQGQVQ